MKCPSASTIAARFVKYAPQRQDRYEDGVRNPAENWEDKTVAAEDNYNKGVTAAIARKAFGKGVKKCGTSRQQSRTIVKGIPRWVEGISGAEADMSKAMEPVVAVLEATTLPPRFPTGDERNYERVKTVGKALRKAKEEGRI
ncbi:hypothetical protein ES708_23257 [subsurface metagenome]